MGSHPLDHPLDQWQLKDFEPGSPVGSGWVDSPGWIDATAPGDTHAALVAAQRIGHPFAGRNEAAAGWIAGREWRWRSRFDAVAPAAGERVELIFDGLDTFADIYLNSSLLGSADNMFHDWRFDVAGALRNGANELLLVFHPTAAMTQGREVPTWGPGAMSDKMVASRRTLMRKAQFGWGWDWGPELPTVGIWRGVRLQRWHTARIDEVRATVRQVSAERCELTVDIGLERAAPGTALAVRITLLDPEGTIAAATTASLDQSASVPLVVPQPRLWWTADLGAQPLYQLVVTLLDGEQAIDHHDQSLGLRTLVLDQSPDPDEPGTTFFRFILNGVPIVARGACWIPASSFVGVVDEAHYRRLLQQAVTANMNMIRVWGGGVYEHDAFYDLCDRLGLLVWQDFMFACAPYPEDDARFVESVRREVRYQARRLRHHASLALWCGNNECQVFRFISDRMFGKEEPLLGDLYYQQLIPEALNELDPATPYWPGSPWGGPSPNSMRGGDVHNWTVWHGLPPIPDKEMVGKSDRSAAGLHYKRYSEDMARFVSEFGIHSAPPLSSLQRWMDPADLALGSPGFLDRIKDDPKDKVNAMLEPVTGLPANLEEYVDFTMLLQAEGLKYGIEHFRRRKPHCSGTLIWQLNDCWPCVSWSLLDYDGSGKASLYAVTRAYAPVLASFKPLADGAVELWITNDSLQPLQGEATVELARLGGGSEWSAELHYAVPANSSQPVWRGQAPAESPELVLQVRAADAAFAANRYLLAPIKDLRLQQGARPQYEITALNPHELEVRLSAEAWLLFVAIEAPQAGTRFSDNYFDLRPGEERSIRVSNAERPVAPAPGATSAAPV